MNNQNPSAFPVIRSALGTGYRNENYTHPIPYTEITTEGGMTLADHFAGQAMAAMIAKGDMDKAKAAGVSDEINEKALAFISYTIAEAMLAERARRNKEVKQ